MAKGLLYFAQNPAFQHLTKIGKTTKLDVEDRGLSASNVPENFGYLAVLKCDDVDWAEKKVHEQFAGYRHYTQSMPKRKTEFFWSGCIKDAINYAKDLKGVFDSTESETEDIEIETESTEKQVKKIPRTTFEMIGLNVGTEIHWYNDNSIVAVVADNKNQILYKGNKGAISTIASEINVSKGFTATVSGFCCFSYNGTMLFKLRPDQQDKD